MAGFGVKWRSWMRWVVLFLVAARGAGSYAHDHINGGAMSTDVGSALVFSNGDRYSTSKGWVLFLDDQDDTGVWQFASGLTFGALPGSVSTGGPVAGHAALGSFLELEFVELTGPKGARMAVWERDEDFGSLTPLLEMETGETHGLHRIPLSESDGSPDSDPYGHIHGREFWVDQPGLYVLKVRLVDTSTNGSDGGPIHKPSGILSFYLQAKNTLQGEFDGNSGVRLTYAVRGTETWAVEESATLGEGAVWSEVHRTGGLTYGFLASYAPERNSDARFYRLQRVSGF